MELDIENNNCYIKENITKDIRIYKRIYFEIIKSKDNPNKLKSSIL